MRLQNSLVAQIIFLNDKIQCPCDGIGIHTVLRSQVLGVRVSSGAPKKLKKFLTIDLIYDIIQLSKMERVVNIVNKEL